MPKEPPYIKNFIELINKGENVPYPVMEIDQLNMIMKGVDKIDNLINSGVVKALLESGEIKTIEDLKEQFKAIKIQSELADISKMDDKYFTFEKYPPDQNVLLNLVNVTSEVDSLLELIDNSLDAITLSESGENPYKIHLAFLKTIKPGGNFQYSILIIDNGCGITKDKFDAVARLGQSGSSKEKQSLIGTWGSGLLISGFRLGEQIRIETVEEYTKEGGILPRPMRIYIIEAAYYIETKDPNEMWKVKREKDEVLAKKEKIKTRGGKTMIQIDIFKEEAREREIEQLFTGDQNFYNLLRDLILFKLSKKLKTLKQCGKNVQIRISAPNIDDVLFNNFSEEDESKYFNYLDHFSYNPLFCPILIKNIPIDPTKIERTAFDLEGEAPDIKIKELVIGLSTRRNYKIEDDFVSLYTEQTENIERNGVWMWGNGRLFTHEIIYPNEQWPFDNPNRTTVILHQICIYLELEAKNAAGNRLIPWEFPSKRKLEFSVNFKQVLRDIVNPLLKDFRIAIPKLTMPSLNARLFPYDLLKDDLKDDEIEKIIRTSFEASQNNLSERKNYDRNFTTNLSTNIPELVKIFKKLKEKGYLNIKKWEYSQLIADSTNEKVKYYQNLDEYIKNFKADYGKRVKGKGNKKVGYPPSLILIRNLKKIFPDLSEEDEELKKIKEKEEEARKREEEAKKQKVEARKREEEAKKQKEEAKKREEEAKKQKEEAKKVEEFEKKKQLEEKAKKAEEEAKKLKEEAEKRASEEEKRAREAEKKEEEARKEVEEAKKKIEAVKKEAEEEEVEEEKMMELEEEEVKITITLLDFEIEKIKEIIMESNKSEAVLTIVRGWLSENSDEETSTE